MRSVRLRRRDPGRNMDRFYSHSLRRMASMTPLETKVGDLCQELGITRQTLYRHVAPKGELRADGERLLYRGSSA